MSAFADHAYADETRYVTRDEGDVACSAGHWASLLHGAEAKVFAGLAPLIKEFAICGRDSHRGVALIEGDPGVGLWKVCSNDGLHLRFDACGLLVVQSANVAIG